MSSTGLVQHIHPIAGFATRLHTDLDGLVASPTWSMTPDELRQTLVSPTRAESRLAELRLRVLASADSHDVAATTAAASTAAWLAHETRQPRPAAHGEVGLALSLDRDHRKVREALAAGHLDVAQARVVVAALDALPDGLRSADRERAERHLVHLAGEHDAAALKVLGRRVLEVIDPEGADDREGRRLEAEEARAARVTSLQLLDNGDGTHIGRFKISTVHAAMLTKMLHAFTNPRHRHGSGGGTTHGDRSRRSRPEMLGQAFCELLERIPAHRLPKSGGVNATVAVLLDYDRLSAGTGRARLDTGEEISAGLARRLACEAGIVPVVVRRLVDGPSVVLDMGRRRRLHDQHQRLALAIEQTGCTVENCDRPAGWCHAHHEVAWSDGGHTSLANGRLLCPFHHGRAHSPRYDLSPLPDGKIRFHRRT